MATINITDKFKTEQPSIQIGEKSYPVDNSVEAVLKFEELAEGGGTKALLSALETALGKEAYKEIGVSRLSVANLKVLTVAMMAAMQDISYEEAAARFQGK
ncbi:hypothetical protein D3C74_172280 [compost metagenome]